jgi:multicomponent Na+:H+ antiporter subunit B
VTRALRWWVLGLGVAGVGVVLVLAFLGMPAFGSSHHPYRDLAVPASVAHATPNVVSSVNFDQRAIDTLGEETILFGSVLAVAALLRPAKDEQTRPEPGSRAPLEATRLLGYVLMPVTLVVGIDMVVHGHLTPGGGFQGGVVLATGLHLLYVAGQYRSLEKLRPMPLYEISEAAGTAAFAALGFAGLAVTGGFLANVVPFGSFGQLLSSGTVPLFNVGVGVAVGSGCVVMLAKFFEQVFLVTNDGAPAQDGDPAGDGNGS